MANINVLDPGSELENWTRAIQDAAGTRILVAGTRSGWVRGAVGPVQYRLLEKVVPGGAVKGGALLRYDALITRLVAANGWNWVLKFIQGANTVNVASNFGDAALVSSRISGDIVMSGDRKWGHNVSLSAFATPSLVAGTYTNFLSSVTLAPALKSARNSGNGPDFVSYSGPAETILIDFDQDFTVAVDVGVGVGDTAELTNFVLLSMSSGAANKNTANAKATLCPGDSLTEGTGSTANNDWVSVLAGLHRGRPFMNFGIGGQTSLQITDRVLADPVISKYWDMVLWMGINDNGTDGAAWFATLDAQIQRILAVRDPSARLPIICNFHYQTDWNASYIAATDYVNAALLTKYGAQVCDLATVINGNAGYFSDVIHLNDTGYAAVAAEISAKMTALVWA